MSWLCSYRRNLSTQLLSQIQRKLVASRGPFLTRYYFAMNKNDKSQLTKWPGWITIRVDWLIYFSKQEMLASYHITQQCSKNGKKHGNQCFDIFLPFIYHYVISCIIQNKNKDFEIRMMWVFFSLCLLNRTIDIQILFYCKLVFKVPFKNMKLRDKSQFSFVWNLFVSGRSNYYCFAVKIKVCWK